MKKRRSYSSAAMVAVAAALMLNAARARVQSPAQPPKPAARRIGNAENGKKLFTKYGCYECHGREAQGSAVTGPRLGPDPVPFEVLAPYVRKPAGQMPPYTSKVVSDADLVDIYAFLQSLPHPPDAKTNPLLN